MKFPDAAPVTLGAKVALDPRVSRDFLTLILVIVLILALLGRI